MQLRVSYTHVVVTNDTWQCPLDTFHTRVQVIRHEDDQYFPGHAVPVFRSYHRQINQIALVIVWCRERSRRLDK